MDYHRWTNAIALHYSQIIETNPIKVHITSHRWHNHLSPNITKNPWNIQDETALFDAHSKLGNKWK